MLEITSLCKKFKGRTVLAIESLSFPPGIHWLRGANGSGKSTLLNILAGLLPFEGNVSAAGHSLKKQPLQYRAVVNHAPAEPRFPAFLTGSELFQFVAALKNSNAPQRDFLCEQLGIDHFLCAPTGTYSSGMLKKLSLLLAFCGQPKWILLDEPFTTLDPFAQQLLANLILQQHRQGISFLLTSHHQVDAGHFNFTSIADVVNGQIQLQPHNA